MAVSRLLWRDVAQTGKSSISTDRQSHAERGPAHAQVQGLLPRPGKVTHDGGCRVITPMQANITLQWPGARIRSPRPLSVSVMLRMNSRRTGFVAWGALFLACQA